MTHRPLLHFTPRKNWMNDPNGLVFHRGRYHLYFQHNPWGTDHANMSWGHASSVDLVTWTEHPVAILADEHEQIFSGSIVIDHDNTAGFAAAGETALVAVYTSVSAATGIQSQALAWSVDDGMTWTKYAGNPVLDRGSRDFRDPKVFRHEGPAGPSWVMVAVEATERRVVLYGSADLKSWEYLSDYGPAGAVGGVWECPDLFPLAVDGDPDDVRWVLLISLNPGGVAGGSGTQYVVGRFDGVTFTPDAPKHPVRAAGVDRLDWLDYGRDCYAGVTFSGLPDDRRTLIAWMSDWDYAREMPPAPWRGAMTTARHLTLETHDGRAQLRATPVLPAGEQAESVPRSSAEVVLPGAARIDLRMPGAGELEFSSAGSPGVVLRWSPSEIVLDRFAHSEVHPEFPSAERMPLPEDPGAVTIVVDTTSIEVFAAGGLRTLTDLVAWQGPVSIRVAEGNVEGLTVADLVPAAQNAPVVVIGESLIDVVDRNSRLSRHVGGSPLNVAYGLGRLGIPALFATEFAGDSDGAAIADHLAAAGVSIHMTSGAAERTATAIAHLGPDGSASYEFDVDWRFETPPTATQAEAVHVGSVGALRSPGGDRVLAYIEALPDDVLITFDPNIRPAVMPARERTRALVERYAARAAVVKLSDEDAAWLYPGETDVASRLLGLGARLVAITRGAEGSQLHTPSASVRVGSVPVRTVDTIGAGDAYMTGLIGAILTEIGTSVVLSGDLTQSDLERIGEVAALAAGLTVARAGAQPPTGNELALGGGILSAAR